MGDTKKCLQMIHILRHFTNLKMDAPSPSTNQQPAMNSKKAKSKTIRITLCAPADVSKELAIITGVIEEWNVLNWDSTNCGIKCRHWVTDAVPDMSDRPQGIINGQLIDDTDAIFAVFWSRFGTPTGLASSGTEEEVRRALALGKRVFLYFSDLEPLPAHADDEQLSKLSNFRAEMLPKGLAWRFKNRTELKDFAKSHLAKFMHEMIRTKAKSRKKEASGVSQSGNGNTQIVGDNNNVYALPPVIKNIVAAPQGSITTAEQKKIADWIEGLVENTTRQSRSQAYACWWSRLKKKFNVVKYELIRSEEMEQVESWQRQQMAILKSERKTKAPETWRNDRIAAIKAAMSAMGRSNAEYYPELSDRLNMKRGFTSVTRLTKTDLDRVYRMVLADARKRN